MAGRLPPGQASFDDLGTPLRAVTFAVVDLETTGGSPADCAITEVGAVKYRGGECLGTLQTLVNPGTAIPPLVTLLTGITEAMVVPAPPIDAVLPPLLEFFGGAVLVGHNLRFDIAFLDAALRARGYPRLRHRRVDTIGLARRLVRDEVPDLRLATLARHLRASTTPIHRALDDARATAEVLHALLERAGTLGVLGLDDLLALPSIRAHPSAGKLKLTARLPRRPGIYVFRDRDGRVLYVGKATNLRARVRSYFGGDDRRKVPQLLRETEAIEHRVCAHGLEASVRELRLIREHLPRFNRQAKAWRAYAYLKLTTTERFPRLAVVRAARADGCLYLGPLPSAAAAHAVREAVESAVALRRCTTRMGKRVPPVTGPPCLAAQLGVATCPCRGHIDDAAYAMLVDRVVRGLTGEPHLLVGPLAQRMRALTETERFEEAALTRDRLRALARALERERMLAALRAAGRIVLDTPEGRVQIIEGRLVLEDDPPLAEGNAATGASGGEQRELASEQTSAGRVSRPAVCEREEMDELLAVARWLRQGGAETRVRETTGPLASPFPNLLSYDPARRVLARRR